ncbi:MAG: flagellar FlbD family protein [Spirochaetales bacterium]|nr:flagellar FlbD family protein [Spirochaetales bacterium]MBR2317695.1 flagellar FlbD family protein [Spirochaetales bacterium]
MIQLTKLNGTSFYLNHLLIEKIEITPDTVITMNSQTQYVVKESIEEINNQIRSEK